MKQKNSNNHSLPNRLLHIKHPPKEIFYQGDIDIIDNGRNIAVIGSRKVSDKGIKLSFATGYQLAKMNITVVNGLALGCDTYALKGALSAGGKCIAIMPCSLDQIVPKSNCNLAQEILSTGGCLISEYPTGTKLEKYMYIERDRLQSAVSDAIIVIEASQHSGTMHTVKAALEQGKSIASLVNSGIDNHKYIQIIKNTDDLQSFINRTYNSTKYFQMSINDITL